MGEPPFDNARREQQQYVALSRSRGARRAAEIGVPIGIYAVLAVLAFSPLWPLDATKLPNGALGDPVQMAWFLAWTPFAVLHGHNPLLTNFLDYPGGVNLAENTSVPLLGLLAAPVTLTIGPVAALNVLLRLALFTSGTSMFFVLRRWCHWAFAAFVGGLLYGFGPYVAAQIHSEAHLNLIFLPLPPLLAYCFDEAFVAQRSSARRIGVAAGVIATAQLLISPEILSDCAIVASIGALGLALFFRDALRERLRHALQAIAYAGATFVLLGGFPIYEMTMGPGHLSGPVQGVAHLQSFRSDLLGPFLPTARQLLAPASAVQAAMHAAAPLLRAGGSAQLGSYLGIPLIALCIGLCAVLRRDRTIVTLGALGLVAFVLSLGRSLQVDGHLTGVPLPEVLLAHLPVLDSTLPARFAMLVALFVAMLVALGIERSRGMLRARPPSNERLLRTSGAVALGMLALLAAAPAMPFVREQPALSAGITSVLDRTIPNGAVVLASPYPDPPYDVAMLWQAADKMRFRMLGGYVTVSRPGGKGAFWPPLLSPDFVQEYLTEEEAGRPRHYPAPAEVASPARLLCSYLERYSASAVVEMAYGPGASAIDQLFARALGRPVATGAGLKIWRVAPRHGGTTDGATCGLTGTGRQH